MSSWYQKIKDISLPLQRGLRDSATKRSQLKCKQCGKKINSEELEKNLFICSCGNHFQLSTRDYLDYLFDSGKYSLKFENILTDTKGNFTDLRSYDDRIAQAYTLSSFNEAAVVARGKVAGISLWVICLNFDFIAGSIGSVVGERISRTIDGCINKKEPLFLISKSGGARLMEGTTSLYQMTKITASINKLEESKIPFISLLTDPSIGMATSVAMLADIVLAEPGALIGYTSPKILKDSVGKSLKKGFQRAETIFQNGFIDSIVPRDQLKSKLSALIHVLVQ